ncbi:hypothetical protein KUCAC02_008111 [Chaenocephalus aceratus]|uniref:Uncharacterized protein n=1 Tax=Chaenocephalus aceratus TaxID=36190 RepID=A0ACB9X9J7_CHAAC|nr:hypothetical protein KUCAC02_008111 [Chaenocephalus aceratus]
MRASQRYGGAAWGTDHLDGGPWHLRQRDTLGPDDHSCEVHQHRQHVACCQDFVKCREERQKAADGKDDDEEGKDEANGVDSDTPLEALITKYWWWSKQMKMMQATKASRTLRRPGTVDRNPLSSPGLARVSPTSTAYRIKTRQEVTAAAGASVEPGIDDGRC